MVLFRPVLGRKGSYLPSVLNVAQLLGWTSVEFWAIGRLANTLSTELFGLDAPIRLGAAAILRSYPELRVAENATPATPSFSARVRMGAAGVLAAARGREHGAPV